MNAALRSGLGWLLLCVAACKPVPGGSCEQGEARCLDAKREIVCDDGKFVETPCRGKAGCSTVEEATTCDISGNQPGDPCSKSEEGVAACSGPDAMLTCRSGKFDRVACRGPKGCDTAGGQPHCDQSVGELGDACKLPNAKACSADKLSVLSCRDGALGLLYACRGEGGCSSAAGKLACDQTVARLNDACDKGLDGHVACTEDKRALLICKDAAFRASERCKTATSCTVAGQSTSCTKPDP